MSQKTRTIKKHVSFDPVDFDTVQSVRRSTGLRFAPALRVIIREWREQRPIMDVIHAYASGLLADGEVLQRLAALGGRLGRGEAPQER